MTLNLTQKLIRDHLVAGEMTPGSEIAIRIDQTLTQDSTGTMAYLQLEALGVPRVRTKRSLAFIDHNTLQTGAENADDHKYIQTVTRKYGVWCSKPGNGICHQVHLERFGVPGWTLLGSDSHTPTGGGLAQLAIGAGGLDVAVAMAVGAYYLSMPRVVEVRLTGVLQPFVSAKDVILALLKTLTVKGGVGRVIEYTGPGVQTLSVPERATITNMGAELGATASVFPSDEVTRAFLAAQGREADFRPLAADVGAAYDLSLTIDLSALEPMVACPHSPDNVVPVRDVAGTRVDQVCIGSCTNSSLMDMLKVAALLKGRTVHPDVSLVISPGSRQVLSMLSDCGALRNILDAGARVVECACGPCIGMGQAPATDAVSVRTFNRNFFGRSGTKSAQVFLASPETAVAAALSGRLTDPRDLGTPPSFVMPDRFAINDNLILAPAPQDEADAVEIIRGPGIKPFPLNHPLTGDVSGAVLLKMGDNITTDHISPAGAKFLPHRSNIPYLADYCLSPVDEGFPARAKAHNGGILVAGQNYGQGSSREHAALTPLQLGIRAVIAKSFARIHMANLINSGILPLTFADEADYDAVDPMDELLIPDAAAQVASGAPIRVENRTRGTSFAAVLDCSPRLRDILAAGGLLLWTKAQTE